MHPQVDHDIEVVGWGDIRNSWGTYWGELGFFRLERGKNALQIEAGDCWCALSLGFSGKIASPVLRVVVSM